MMDDEQQKRFAALWHAHRGIAFKIAFVYTRGREDRHDLVQEIGVQLWRSFANFDARRAQFSTWMYRVALNVAISQVRRHARSGVDRLEPLDAHHVETIAGPDAHSAGDPRLEVLHGVIERLDPFNRALVLLYLEDRSHAEIADILGISTSNVATKFARIKQKLRAQVAANDPTTTGA